MERLTHDYVRIIVELTEMRIANQFGELRPIIAKQFRSPPFRRYLPLSLRSETRAANTPFGLPTGHRAVCGCEGRTAALR
jgi:hypothetical protein